MDMVLFVFEAPVRSPVHGLSETFQYPHVQRWHLHCAKRIPPCVPGIVHSKGDVLFFRHSQRNVCWGSVILTVIKAVQACCSGTLIENWMVEGLICTGNTVAFSGLFMEQRVKIYLVHMGTLQNAMDIGSIV
jgi:hypothetical protein